MNAADRFYRSRLQVIFGWLCAVMTVGLSAMVLVLPTARHHGGYVLAPIFLLFATGCVRFARCGVHVTPTGVRVTNMLSSKSLAWQDIEGFELSRFGASVVRLKGGGVVAIVGIEQTNIAGLLKRKNTPERRMIDQLNALLAEHSLSS